MEDMQIVELFFERDECAIRMLAEKYGRYCFTVAYNILFDKQDSEECVEDTYIHTWNAIPPQKPNILKAFVARITRNLALDRYEKDHALKRGGGQVDLVYEELEGCIGSNGDKTVDDITLRAIINDLLKSLPEEQRVMFVKRYWYMESIEDIAAMLNCSVSKVKMSLLRNRARLQKVLEREYYGS